MSVEALRSLRASHGTTSKGGRSKDKGDAEVSKGGKDKEGGAANRGKLERATETKKKKHIEGER